MDELLYVDNSSRYIRHGFVLTTIICRGNATTLGKRQGREYDRTKKEEVEIIERSVIKSSAVDWTLSMNLWFLKSIVSI